MTRLQRGQLYCDEAERLLRWGDAWLAELREHGRHARIEAVERVLFAAFGAIASAHDALASAANFMGRPEWCEALHRLQADDPLLRFLWLAPKAEPRSPVVRWCAEGANPEPQVVDANKLRHITSLFYSPLNPQGAHQRLAMYAHGASTHAEFLEKVRRHAAPDPQRLQDVGMVLTYPLQALALQDFDVSWNGRTERVPVPAVHLGIRGEHGRADKALEAGIAFYRSKLEELGQRTEAR